MNERQLVVRCYSTQPNFWESNISKCPQKNSFLQTKYWASIIQKVRKGRSLYLTVVDGETVVAQTLLVLRSTKLSGWKNFFYTLFFSDELIEFPATPIFLDESVIGECFNALTKWVLDYARDKHISFIRIPLEGVLDPNLATSIPRRYREYCLSKNRWATYIIDLSMDETLLLKSFSHAARKGINKAMREKVVVKQLKTWFDFENFFVIPYLKWTKDLNASNFFEEMAICWEMDEHHKYYRYFAAIHPNGDPIAVLGMYLYNGEATEIASAISDNTAYRAIPGQDILHWEMFLAAKLEGCSTFNLAGVSPSPSTIKERNIKQFKKKWEGSYVEYSILEYRHSALSLFHECRDIVRNIRQYARKNYRN